MSTNFKAFSESAGNFSQTQDRRVTLIGHFMFLKAYTLKSMYYFSLNKLFIRRPFRKAFGNIPKIQKISKTFDDIWNKDILIVIAI